jgi:hypothetical protein
MFTWQGLETMKRHTLEFILVINFGWSKLSIWGDQLWNPITTKHWLILSFFFFHMVQYVVYYNFHVYKFGFIHTRICYGFLNENNHQEYSVLFVTVMIDIRGRDFMRF